MRHALILSIAALTVAATRASAQEAAGIRVEIRPYVGAYVPAGKLADDFKTATTLGAQGALEIAPFMHIVTTVGWTHGHNKYAAFSDDLTHIWHYDIGAEFNLTRSVGPSWLLKPFAGIGAGGRTYDYQAANVGTYTCTAGYGAVGTEFQKNVVALRLEARSYLACFESPVTGKKKTLSDFGIAFGVAYHMP